MKEITIYTDGSSRGNPGPGGYGTVMIYKSFKKELGEGFRRTTNNRMELMAAIKGLEAIKEPGWNVLIYSDSKYVVDSVDKGWLFDWEKKYFKGKKNEDLWRKFLHEYRKHKVRFQWVKGHAGNPGNERCDEIATQCADNRSDLKTDHGFEAYEKAGME